MMKLSIRPQVKRKNRFSVFLVEEYLCSISAYTYEKLGAKPEIETESVEEFQKNCLFPEQYNYCLELLSRRMYSTGELTKKLSEHSCPPAVSEAVIKKLTEAKLLSDEDYKESFVRSRQTYKKQGYYKIRQELSRRGISLDSSEYDREAELANLKELVASLLGKQVEPRKIISRLMAKGYRFSDIREAMKEDASQWTEELEYEVTEDA